MLMGYARVSTRDQDTEAQIAALEKSGCELIFKEKASGARWERPELHRLLGQLRKGDMLVVWKLDRLSRSLKDLLTLMEKIGLAGAGFRSLTEAIDTTSAGGRMMMQIVGSFAEFERAMLRERTRSGLDAQWSGRGPQTGTSRRKTPQTQSQPEGGDSAAGKLREENRSRCSATLRRPSLHRVAAPPECRKGALNQFYVPLLPKPRSLIF